MRKNGAFRPKTTKRSVVQIPITFRGFTTFFEKKAALTGIFPIKNAFCSPIVYSCANFRRHMVVSFVKMAKTMFQSSSFCCIFFHVSV